MPIRTPTVSAAYVRPAIAPTEVKFPFPISYTNQPIRMGFDYKVTATNAIESTVVNDDFSSKEATTTRKLERTVTSVVDWKLTSTTKGSFSAKLGFAGLMETKSLGLSAGSDIELKASVGTTMKNVEYSVDQTVSSTKSTLRNKVDQINRRTIELIANSGYIRTVLEIDNPTDDTVLIEAIDLVFLQTDEASGIAVPLLNLVLGATSQLNGTVPGAAKISDMKNDVMEIPPTLAGAPFIRTISIEGLPNQVILDWMKRGGPLLIKINSSKIQTKEGVASLVEAITVPFRRDHVQVAVLTSSSSENHFFVPDGSFSLGELIATLVPEQDQPLEIAKIQGSTSQYIHSLRGLTSSQIFTDSTFSELYRNPESWTLESGTWVLESSVELPPEDPFGYTVKPGEMFRITWVSGADLIKAVPPEFHNRGVIATLPASSNPANMLMGFPFKWFGVELVAFPFAILTPGLTPVSVLAGINSRVRLRCRGYRSCFSVVESEVELPEFYGKVGSVVTRVVQKAVEPIGAAEQINMGFTLFDGDVAPYYIPIRQLIQEQKATITDVGQNEFEIDFIVSADMVRGGEPIVVLSFYIEPPVYNSNLGRRFNLIPRPDLVGVPARAPENDPFPWVDNERIQEAQVISIWARTTFSPQTINAQDGRPASLDRETYEPQELQGDDDTNLSFSVDSITGGWPISLLKYSVDFSWKDRCYRDK